MKKEEQKWWSALSGWLVKNQGRVDYLFMYDGKHGRLDRCFDRNISLGNVDDATVSRLYRAAAEGRLGLLRPKDLKPQLLTANPDKIFISGKELTVAAERTAAAEQTVAAAEQPSAAAEQTVVEAEQAVMPGAKGAAVETQTVAPGAQTVVSGTQVAVAGAQMPAAERVTVKGEQTPKVEQAPVTVEPGQVSRKPQENAKAGTEREVEGAPKLDDHPLERAVAEPVLADRMREAEAYYRQMVYAPKKEVKPAPVEGSGGERSVVRTRMKQAAALEQAMGMLRTSIPQQPEEGLSREQKQLAVDLAQMLLSIGEVEDQDEERRERERKAKQKLAAAQNLFIWSVISDKREQEQMEAWMEHINQTEKQQMLPEWEWRKRTVDMARMLRRMDLSGISESECGEKIRDFLDGKAPEVQESGTEQEEMSLSGEMLGNALRHFCRFAASEVPLSIRHVQVAEQCRLFLEQAKENGISMDELGLDPQDRMVLQGTIEMGALVEQGLLAQASLTSDQRLSGAQYQSCLKSYLAMKGLEEALIPHVQMYQKEISAGEGPISAMQILMANPGFHAKDLQAKAGRTSAVARLARMNPARVGEMIRQGGEEIASMARQVMMDSCQMGEVRAPAREPKAPQKSGPVR